MSEATTEAPASASGAPAPAESGAAPATGAWLRAWLLAGVATIGLELLASLRAEVPFSAGGALLVAGLWTLAALIGAGVTRGLARLAAPGSLDACAAAIRRALASAGGPEERIAARRTSATLLSVPIALLSLGALSGISAYLVVTGARAPAFIALALGGLAPLLATLALLLGVALRRALLRWRLLPTPRAALVGLALAAILFSSALVATQHETLVHLGADALLPPVFLITLALALFVAMPGPLPRAEVVALAAALLASLALIAGWRLPRARSFTSRATFSASYLVAGLQAASDLDRDGVASFPFGSDCAALDPARSPLARELPGNQVDENCDGSDAAPSEAASAAAAATFVPLTGEQPDLFLITVDALRADHLGFMGYRTHPTSPDVDPIAERGVVFERAYSQDSGTAPSMWSLMVGKTPFQVELVAEGFPPNYAESETTLAERLKAAGYTTHARLCGSLFLAPGWNLRRGFDEFEEVCNRRPRELGPFVVDSARPLLAPPAGDAAAALHERPPRFVWLHFFDPHHPYVDHTTLAFGDQPIDFYDEEIRYVQTFVAEALRLALDEAHGRPRFVVLSADHGENFSEHGRDPHARTLYREVTHVPLVILGTGLEPRRVSEAVALGDVFPTFLNLAGVPTPPGSTMESLVPVLLGGDPDPERPVFQENSWSRPTHHVKALILGRHHLIRDLTSDTTELYDVVADPRERVDLSETDTRTRDRLLRQLETFIGTTHIPEAYR